MVHQAVIEAAEETGRDPDPPPFHYATHYSCAGYILHYLLRLEPFTRLALALQGGRFDKADRLFRDIRSSWESASRENLQVLAILCFILKWHLLSGSGGNSRCCCNTGATGSVDSGRVFYVCQLNPKTSAGGFKIVLSVENRGEC